MPSPTPELSSARYDVDQPKSCQLANGIGTVVVVEVVEVDVVDEVEVMVGVDRLPVPGGDVEQVVHGDGLALGPDEGRLDVEAEGRDRGGQRGELREVVGEALAADEGGVLVPRVLHRDLGRVHRGGVPSAGCLRGDVVYGARNDTGVVERALKLPARARLVGLSEMAGAWQTEPGRFKRRRCGPPGAGRRCRLL